MKKQIVLYIKIIFLKLGKNCLGGENMNVWKDEEVKNLFSEVEKCKKDGVALKKAFLLHAQKYGRQANSVRNYYYLEAKNINKDKDRCKRIGIDENKHQQNHYTPFGRNEEKRVLADRCGVDNYINTTQEQSDVQYDLTFEAVGTNASLLQAISKTKSGGQILLVGNPYSDMQLPKDVYWQILRRQITLIGTWNSMYENGAESDWSNVLKLLSTGKVDTEKAITHIFAQDKLFDALDVMRDHNVPYGRIVVKFNE